MLKIFLPVWMSLAFFWAQALKGGTIQTTYAFTESATNIVIENGFLTGCLAAPLISYRER